MVSLPSLQLPTYKWRSTGPGRSLCLLSITGLAALDGQYHSLSGTYFSASSRVTCLLPATQAGSHAGPKVYIWNVFGKYLALFVFQANLWMFPEKIHNICSILPSSLRTERERQQNTSTHYPLSTQNNYNNGKQWGFSQQGNNQLLLTGTYSLRSLRYNRGGIQRKTWCMGSYAGVDYNLTLC